jgi:4-diphosphocytidyl-2-C-methyl-D-erythritol kinase
VFKAYAKINLGLRILKEREDGFHDIETVLHPVDIFDSIGFENEDKDIRIESTDPRLPMDETNLCWQAADALRREAGVSRGVRIVIEKKIPIGAGLGGGSSNAGLVLRELPQFWQVVVDTQRLHEIAASLGADVPYFLRGGTALATGKGDILEYFDLSLPYWILIVYPNIHISTKWAYRNFDMKNQRSKIKSVLSDNRRTNSTLKELLLENITKPNFLSKLIHNDLEPTVFEKHEAIKQTKHTLIAGGAEFAQMSGSGSAVYGLFRNEEDARGVASSIGANLPVFLTEPNFQVGP